MIYVLVPAHNEEAGLAAVLGGLRELVAVSAERYLIVVIDDGSTDDTRPVAQGFARALDLWLVSHVCRQGAGAALRTGLELVLQDSGDAADVVVTLDADGSHDPRLIPELLRALRKRHADVALASRLAPGGSLDQIPRLRRWLVRAAALCWTADRPVAGVRDQASGYRAYRVPALRAAREEAETAIPVAVDSTGAIELLRRIHGAGSRVVEVPLALSEVARGGPRRRWRPAITRAITLLASAPAYAPVRREPTAGAELPA